MSCPQCPSVRHLSILSFRARVGRLLKQFSCPQNLRRLHSPSTRFLVDANLRSVRSCDRCSSPCDVTTFECLTVNGIVICHLRSVSVVIITHVIPLVLGLGLTSSTPVLPHAFILPFPRHMESQNDLLAPARGLSMSLSDMLLICLNRDAGTIPLNDTVKYSSTLLKVWIFPITCFLISYFSGHHLDEEFQGRPLPTDCDVIAAHSC